MNHLRSFFLIRYTERRDDYDYVWVDRLKEFETIEEMEAFRLTLVISPDWGKIDKDSIHCTAAIETNLDSHYKTGG